ncbi:MAG: sulfate/molybdate ABC transporter ATP-binding protein [Candidatus Binatia bacterium]|nr:sulfate/molybdate ABC transporter ATP-binding protein [Candidatus Binatia bacterium]
MRVEGVSKSFGRFVALDNVSFTVPTGSLLALLGPSGSGKTTLLRIIAGLEQPDRGLVLYRGRDVTGESPHQRNVGFVFQHYALFRHLTVYENVAFGLRVRRWPRRQVDRRVRELLHLVRLEGLEGKRPAELSGGQRQRVALARALAAEPEVLLLDEPFGALDAKVRRELREWLRRLHDEIGVTSVFVTHDQEEAFEVADQVVLLNHGKVEQTGTPVEVFEHPANAFVTEFLGYVNKFPGRVREGQGFVAPLGVSEEEQADGEAAVAYVRPHELEVDRIPRGVYSVEARLLRVNPLGGTVKLELHAVHFGMVLRVELPWERYAELRPQPAERLFVFPKKMRVFVHNYQI